MMPLLIAVVLVMTQILSFNILPVYLDKKILKVDQR